MPAAVGGGAVCASRPTPPGFKTVVASTNAAGKVVLTTELTAPADKGAGRVGEQMVGVVVGRVGGGWDPWCCVRVKVATACAGICTLVPLIANRLPASLPRLAGVTAYEVVALPAGGSPITLTLTGVRSTAAAAAVVCCCRRCWLPAQAACLQRAARFIAHTCVPAGGSPAHSPLTPSLNLFTLQGRRRAYFVDPVHGQLCGNTFTFTARAQNTVGWSDAATEPATGSFTAPACPSV